MSELEKLQYELKMEQERSAYLNNYFNNVLDSMVPGIILTDEDLFVNGINSTITDMLGLKIDKMEGFPLSEFIKHEIISSSLTEDDVNNLHGFETEILILNKFQNKEIPYLMSFSVFKYEDGDIEGVACILTDLTERKKLEGQLVQSQKLESVGQLAAGIAHEINTPIQYVRDNMQFLDEEFDNILKFINVITKKVEELGEVANLKDEVSSEYESCDLEYLLNEIPSAVKQTLEGAEAVAKIVRSMKEFSHPGTDELVGVDVNRAIESTTTVSASVWKYIAELECNFYKDLPFASCFPSDLNQILLNLIVNAAHAIEDVKKNNPMYKGKIIIETKEKKSMILISISDNGTGIPKGIQDKIFNPFFTTKQVGRGTGQGLSFVYNSVVEKQKGKIYFNTSDKGTTFYIELNKSK